MQSAPRHAEWVLRCLVVSMGPISSADLRCPDTVNQGSSDGPVSPVFWQNTGHAELGLNYPGVNVYVCNFVSMYLHVR